MLENKRKKLFENVSHELRFRVDKRFDLREISPEIVQPGLDNR